MGNGRDDALGVVLPLIVGCCSVVSGTGEDNEEKEVPAVRLLITTEFHRLWLCVLLLETAEVFTAAFVVAALCLKLLDLLDLLDLFTLRRCRLGEEDGDFVVFGLRRGEFVGVLAFGCTQAINSSQEIEPLPSTSNS